MFKQSLICATLGGMVSVAASAVAATPAAPTATMIERPGIEQVYWYRGRYYPYRWQGGYWHHRRWYGGHWHYW